MGGSNSVPVPGGGTEAYHVLRVRKHWFLFIYFGICQNYICQLLL